MLYLKPLATFWSPTALKKFDRSKQCHCLHFAQRFNLVMINVCHGEKNLRGKRASARSPSWQTSRSLMMIYFHFVDKT